MGRYLVVYFSWTGNTEQVAEALAETLDADLEPIRETHERAAGPLAHVRATLGAALGWGAPVAPTRHRVADYDVVVIGCPVWANSPPPPLRAWLARERAALKRIALFCTTAHAGGERCLEKVAAIAGVVPVAQSVITGADLRSDGDDWLKREAEFAAAIAEAIPAASRAADAVEPAPG